MSLSSLSTLLNLYQEVAQPVQGAYSQTFLVQKTFSRFPLTRNEIPSDPLEVVSAEVDLEVTEVTSLSDFSTYTFSIFNID